MIQKSEEVQNVDLQEEMHVIFMNCPFNYAYNNSSQ